MHALTMGQLQKLEENSSVGKQPQFRRAGRSEG